MAEKKNAPKLRIEDVETEDAFRGASSSQDSTVGEATRPSSLGGANAGGEQDAPGAQKDSRPHGFSGAMGMLRQWLVSTFPGHENAVLFGFLGFIIAILIFVIGFWRTLLIALIVLLGVAVGQVFDGDPKIFNAIRKFIRDNQG